MTASLDEVRAALQQNAPAGRIDLVAASRTEPLVPIGDLVSVLKLGTRYELTRVAVVESGDRVLLTGTGTFAVPAATGNPVAVEATLEYTIIDQFGRFTLELELPTTWRFGDTFGSLPDCEQLVGEFIEKTPSYLDDLPLAEAVLRARTVPGPDQAELRLAGKLAAAPVFERFADFFPTWPLTVEGPVILPDSAGGPPDFDLVAMADRDPIVAGPVRLSGFGLQLLCVSQRHRADGGPEPYTTLNGLAALALGSGPPVTGAAVTPLLTASAVWRLTVRFDHSGPSLGDGLAGIARAFGLAGPADFALPPGVRLLSGFRFREIETVVVGPGRPEAFSPMHVAVVLLSDHTWTPPVPFLTVTDLGMNWLIGWQGGVVPHHLAGSFFGRVHISPAPDRPDQDLTLDLWATFPAFVISATLRQSEAALDTMLAHFLGVPAPRAGLRIRDLRVTADLSTRTLGADAQLTTDLSFDLRDALRLDIVAVGAWVQVDQDTVTGGFRGEVALAGAEPPGAGPPRLELTGRYAGDEWVFAGGLQAGSVVDLAALVATITGLPRRDDVDLLLTELRASLAIGTGAFSFAATVTSRWTPSILDGLAIAAAASVALDRPDARSPIAARITGEFEVAGFAVAVTADLTTRETTYVFEVSFAGRWIAAEVAWTGTGEERRRVITVHIGGITLGELVEYLASLVAPTLGFRLEPPWDVLNRIDLSRFLLVIDPAKSTVEATYQATVVLPTMTLTGVGVRAQRVNGRPTVMLVLTRADRDPLAWDVLSDPPPRVPGEGTSLVRLDYLGLGQRVRLRDEPPTTLRDAITRLRQALRAPQDPDRAPIGQPGIGVDFDSDAGWLVGLDLTVADTVQVAALLLDPHLYGLAIGLRGEKAKALAGLRFDVLYRKVSTDVGVFRAELEVPETLRRLQLGAVSLTLGVLVVEVYTNGDFQVDLGFPVDGDFSRSFAFELLPFLGRGGIRFAKLSAATASSVPAITNGTFSPVLELGVAIAVGVGKEIRAGVLSGGAYVEVIAVFDGVFAWFNPTGAGTATEIYHRVNAIAAVHGKIYGQIDLSVLKVAVTVEAWAEANVLLESYRATQIRLSARVEVNAELTVAFFHVSFSFAAGIDIAFEIGADRPTPWLLAGTPGGPGRRRAGIAAPPGRVPGRRLARLRQLDARPATPDWDPTRLVFPDVRTARVTVLPLLSLTDVPLAWSAPAPPNPDPHYRAALMMLAPHDDPAGARLWVEAFLRWALYAVTGTSDGDPAATVTAAQVRTLAENLDQPWTADHPFRIDRLVTFFRTNLHLEIAGSPVPGPAPATVDGIVVPIPPRLTLASPQVPGGPRDLATLRPVGPLYLWGASRYAAGLTPTPPPATPPPVDDLAAYLSYDTFLFQDWCLMLARAAVDAAAGALAHWPVALAGPASLAQLADLFPTVTVAYLVRAGDTVDSVAAALGASPAELRYLDMNLEFRLAEAEAGALLSVTMGVAPESVAIDNATVPVATSARLRLGTIDYQVGAGDTLAAIAGQFHRTVASLFPGGLSDPLATDRQLLSPYAVLAVPAVSYPDEPGAGQLLVAATFFTRYRPLTTVESTDWYAAALFDLNAADITWGPGDRIPLPMQLWIPFEYHNADPDLARRYTAVAGDTISSIARALALAQRFGTGLTGPDDWPAWRDSVTTDPDGGWLIPAESVPILPREGLADLAERLITSAGDLETLLGYVHDAPILAPLAWVPVPDVTVLATGQTLGYLADRLGLDLADLAGRIADQPLFEPGQPLAVAHLPVQHIEDLVARVLDSAASTIGARNSRTLLSGTRLPAPEPVSDQDGHVAATGPLTAMVDLTGQQFPAPVPDLGRPDAVAFELEVTTNEGNADWITLVDSVVAGPDDPAPGRVVRTAAVPALTFRYTNAELTQQYPATALGITPVAGQTLAALPAAAPVPRTYGLDHRVALQTPVPLPLPPAVGAARPTDAPTPGGASAWPLPAALVAYARTHPTPWDVVRAARRPDASEAPAVVPRATFATLIPLRVRRLGQPHRYELVGVDVNARTALLRLWLRLRSIDENTRVFLATRPAPDAGRHEGLALLTAAPERTFIVRANQSTQTAPPASSGARAELAAVADLDAPADFTRLLWEGTVVGGTGYAVGYAGPDGSDLPPGIFDDNGVAELAVLVITGDEQEPRPGGRVLYAYENCVLTPADLDASVTGLWIESADDSDVTLEATMPPGTAGFGITLSPPPGGIESPTVQLHRLFSLVRYAIGEGPFQLPDAGLPIGPLADDGLRLPPWQRVRRVRRREAGRAVPADLPAALWRYEQVLPLDRIGPASPCPAVPGLPPPDADPYRGVGSTASVHIGLSDGLGNVSTLPGSHGGRVDLGVRFTDPLLGVSAWPGVTTAYRVQSGPNGVRIRVTVATQPATTMPAVDASAATSSPGVARAAARFAQAYYQLAAGRAEVAVLTSLTPTADGAPAALPVDIAPLRQLCAAAYLASSAAAAVTAEHAGTSIAAIIERYWSGVSTITGAALIATANADRPAVAILGERPVVPAYQVLGDGESVQDMLLRLPNGWPRPHSTTDLLRLDGNAGTELRPGAVLSLAGVAVVVGPEPVSLAGLAAQHHTTPGLLAADNADLVGVLDPDATVEFEGLAMAVGDRTLAGLANAYGAFGVPCDAATLGTANADRDGLFRAGARLTTRHYVARPGDTLATNDSRADLTVSNGSTRGIFAPGTLVAIGTFDPDRVGVGPDETLTGYADRFGCPPERLLAANADRPLAGDPVLVPGAVRLTAADAVRVPCPIKPGDTLAAVAARFPGTDPLSLATDNATMTGTLVAEQTVVVVLDGVRFEQVTRDDDTLAGVHARFTAQDARITLADVIRSIATTAGYLAAGALLSAPTPRLSGPGPSTPSAAAARYGVDPVALGLANSALLGLVQPGVTIHDPGAGTTITTTPDDTLNSLTVRFAARNSTVEVAEIVEANRDVAFLRGDAVVLLPPVPVTLAVDITAGPFATAASPLTVVLRLRRPADLIEPSLRDGPAAWADTAVPPQYTVDSAGGVTTRTLAPFAADFHAALPALRLATGAPGEDSHADLWLVNFGAGGLTTVDIGPGALLPDGDAAPRSFAIRPLYRQLQSRRQVPLPALDDQGNLVSGSRDDVQAVDVELWARRFLRDLDTVLSATYAGGLYDDPVARPALTMLLAAKSTLTGAIARGVAEVLTMASEASPEQLAAAGQTIRDALAVQLGPGYDTAALVQYQATVASPWVDGAQSPPARLLGTATPVAVPETPYQLSAAKTALDRRHSAVTFPLSLPDPARHRAVAVSLEYVVTHLEHDISVIGGSGGYPSSRWLTFYPPLAGGHRPTALTTDLGTATVPIVLRTYPVAPALVGQSADPTVPGNAELADIARWTYAVTYAHEHAAQDEVQLRVSFNVPQTPAVAGPADECDPVVTLARYNAVADQLADLLVPYGGVPADGVPVGGADRAKAANAALSMATLATEVATSWHDHEWPAPPSGTRTDGPTYRFGISAQGSAGPDGTDLLSTVYLRLHQVTPGPTGDWPRIATHLPDGTTVELTPGPLVGDTRSYAAPGPVPRGAWLTLTLTWPGLHVAQLQNAQATVSVRRNESLLGTPGPATNEAFVFETADVTAPTPASPLLIRPDPIDIGGLGGDVGTALATALATFTSDLADVDVTICAWYGFDVASTPGSASAVDDRTTGNPTALRTRLPVTLRPHRRAVGAGAAIAARLDTWLGSDPPTVSGPRWLFSVTVHSSLSDADNRPLLVIDQLGYAIFTTRSPR